MKLSVIIPTYNRAELVVYAVESVLKQRTEAEIEIIVIDDGSRDATRAALEPYMDQIRYVYQRNKGVNSARNRGLEEAGGDYIALLDSDDLWLDFKIDLQLAILNRCDSIGFVFSEFHIYKSPDRMLPRGLRSWHKSEPNWDDIFSRRVNCSDLAISLPPECNLSNADIWLGDIYPASLTDTYVLSSTTLIRRRCLGDIRFPEDEPLGGDREFFARLSKQYGVAFLDLETTLNRSHEDAVRLTRVDSKIRPRRHIRMIRRLWREDTNFMATKRTSVDRQEALLLRRLAILHAFENNSYEARKAWRKAHQLTVNAGGASHLALGASLHLPFGSAMLHGMRHAKHWFAR